MHVMRFSTLTAAVAALTLASMAVAQVNPLQQMDVPLKINSGPVQNHGKSRGVIFSSVAEAPMGTWLRLKFDDATLGPAPEGGNPTLLRLTSVLDGAVQTMTAAHLQQWENTSAYFNGDKVMIEVIADPGAEPSSITISAAWAGVPEPGEPESLCGADDRVLSSEAANARLLPSGCTAWIISDPNRTFLTAGHCGTSGTSVVQFNVPLSNSNGSLNHPPPEHQYTPDAVSIQSLGGGIGDDWCYFGCFPNTQTGLTPFQAQAEYYQLAAVAPPVNGQQIRITGYGTVSSPVPATWNQVQKTHSGPYALLSGFTVKYVVDTTGGNSGSPVFNLDDGTAIGIHTHAGCSTGGNQGTAIHNPGLQNALANPQGVCIPAGFTINVTPNTLAVCAPADAVYNVDIGQTLGSTDPVTLSAAGHPAGTSVSFSVNPVVPPGTSVMTVSGTGAAGPGTSTIEVIGTSVEFQHTKDVALSIANAIPAAPQLIAPSNGANNVAVLPAFSWNASAQAISYDLQVASDAAFTNIVYSATVATTSHSITTALSQVTQYHWRVRAANACGTGQFSNAFSFVTQPVPPILLVDDDNNTPNVQPYYTAALTAAGVTFDLLDLNNNSANEPTLAQMSAYDIIIWFSGDAFGGTGNPRAGPTAASEVALAQWLDAGGCFFLSSQDYLWDRIGSGSTTPNGFMQNYLGMGMPVDHDVSQTIVTGANVFVGYNSALAYPSGLSNFSDMVPPNGNSLSAFNGNQGNTSVTRDGGAYRSIFLAYPFETLPDATLRANVMATTLAWCGKLNIPCPSDVNADNAVDVSDLLVVINLWGPCLPGPCAGDINGDQAVDVTDLLAVISAWGPCP